MMSRLFGQAFTATNARVHTHTPLCTDVSSTKLVLYYRQRANSRKAQIANGEGLRGLLPPASLQNIYLCLKSLAAIASLCFRITKNKNKKNNNWVYI